MMTISYFKKIINFIIYKILQPPLNPALFKNINCLLGPAHGLELQEEKQKRSNNLEWPKV